MPHDIFKRDAAGRMLWIEAAKDLKSGKWLAKKLSHHNEGEFVVFDRPKNQVVASFYGSGATSNSTLSLRVLRLFGEMGQDRLDLHVLFEAAGNEPEERLRVLAAIDELVRAGMLDALGGDFYALTEKGKGAVAQS